MRQIAIFIMALLTGWLLAVCLTWLGWCIQIEGKAFHCTDETFPIVWWGESVDGHRQAGDTLGLGWSWEKIHRAQELYRAAYYVLWLSGAAGTYLFFKKRKAQSRAELGASPNGGPATSPDNSGAREGPPSVS